VRAAAGATRLPPHPATGGMRRGGDGPGPGSTDATRPTLPVPGPAVPAAEPLTRARSRAFPVLPSRTGTASRTLSGVLPGPAPSPAAPAPGIRGFATPSGRGRLSGSVPDRGPVFRPRPGCPPPTARHVHDRPGRVRRRPSCPLLSPSVSFCPLAVTMAPSGAFPVARPDAPRGRVVRCRRPPRRSCPRASAPRPTCRPSPG